MSTGSIQVRLAILARQIKEKNTPEQVRRRKQRERRRIAYLSATGELERKPSRKALRAAETFYAPDPKQPTPVNVTKPPPDFDDDIPF